VVKFFDFSEWTQGSSDFLIPGNRNIAITQEKARQIFGDDHPIGKTVILWGSYEHTVCAVVSEMPGQSNYAFDFLKPFQGFVKDVKSQWSARGVHTIVELHPKTNRETFEKKLYEHQIVNEDITINHLMLEPLSEIRYTDPEVKRNVQFQHIAVFAVSGLLVVLCSLFNYLTLFVSRLRIRQKEFALRIINGASGGSLLSMLSVEFLLVLSCAVLLGGYLIHSLYRPFLTIAVIHKDLQSLFGESLLYIGGIIIVTFIVFWLLLFLIKRRSLNLTIRRSHNNLFRKLSLVAQIVISIGFSFCTFIIIKQLYFLHHSGEIGFAFKNRASIVTRGNSEVIAN